MSEQIIQAFLDAWPAPYVSREQVYKFSGGLASPKTLANADSAGTGPKEKIRFGKRKIAYRTASLATWLAEKIVVTQ